RFAREHIGHPSLDVPRTAAPDELTPLRDDYDNLRSALVWAWETNADELGLDLGAACCRFWLGEGLFRDAAAWLREATPRLAMAPPSTRLQSLKVAGLVAFFVVADSEQAESLWAEARGVAGELRL